MKIAFLTSLRTPYRILQVNEFSKVQNTDITVYYTHKQKENRNWEISMDQTFKEKNLRGMGLFGKYGYINRGLFKIIKETDVVLLGGYEKPTYIFMSLLCRIYNKPYIAV